MEESGRCCVNGGGDFYNVIQVEQLVAKHNHTTCLQWPVMIAVMPEKLGKLCNVYTMYFASCLYSTYCRGCTVINVEVLQYLILSVYSTCCVICT